MAKEKYGFNGEYNFYVGVLMPDNVVKYVTEVDYSVKEALWTEGEPAKVMSKQMAIDLQVGLMCNGYRALVLEAPDWLELCNLPGEALDSESR